MHLLICNQHYRQVVGPIQQPDYSSYNDQLDHTFEHFLSFPDQPHCASLLQSLLLVYCSQVEGPGGPTGAGVCVGLGTVAGAGVMLPEGPAQDFVFPDQEHCALPLQDLLSVNTSQSTGAEEGLGDRNGLAVGAGGSVGPVGVNWLKRGAIQGRD